VFNHDTMSKIRTIRLYVDGLKTCGRQRLKDGQAKITQGAKRQLLQPHTLGRKRATYTPPPLLRFYTTLLPLHTLYFLTACHTFTCCLLAAKHTFMLLHTLYLHTCALPLRLLIPATAPVFASDNHNVRLGGVEVVEQPGIDADAPRDTIPAAVLW
jgi:hypothetical protein